MGIDLLCILLTNNLLNFHTFLKFLSENSNIRYPKQALTPSNDLKVSIWKHRGDFNKKNSISCMLFPSLFFFGKLFDLPEGVMSDQIVKFVNFRKHFSSSVVFSLL